MGANMVIQLALVDVYNSKTRCMFYVFSNDYFRTLALRTAVASPSPNLAYFGSVVFAGR